MNSPSTESTESPIVGLAGKADRLSRMAADPKATAADRESSEGARAAALMELEKVTRRELNNMATISRADFAKMHPRDAATFCKNGGKLTA